MNSSYLIVGVRCECEDGSVSTYAESSSITQNQATCRGYCEYDLLPTAPEKGDYVDYLPPDPSDIRNKRKFY